MEDSKTKRGGSYQKEGVPKKVPFADIISEHQNEVLWLVTEEHLTEKEIAQRYKISTRAIRKTIKKLKDKGLISLSKQGVGGSYHFLKQTKKGLQSSGNLIRLHDEQFKIKIKTPENRIKTRIEIENNKCLLWKNSIDIYSNQSFYGKDEDEAERKSIDYWDRIFNILENDLNILFLKDRKQNIKRVRAHYSETDNEMAKEANKEPKQKITLKAEEDGKEWLKVDNSLNLNEIETVHPKTAKEDMKEVIRPLFTELRANPYFLRDFRVAMTDVKDSIVLMAKLQTQGAELMKETAAATLNIVRLITPVKEEIIEDKKKPEYIG